LYRILTKKEGMFKYYISVPFHCFTQYYGNTKKCYELWHQFKKIPIFRRALYKKGWVGNLPGCRNSVRYSPTLKRFAVHGLVRSGCSGYRKIIVTGDPVSNHLFLGLCEGAWSEFADRVDHIGHDSTPLRTFGCRNKGHPEAAVVKTNALH
jgi:hypothetical protein